MYDLTQAKQNLEKVVTWLRSEYGSVHTGQANPLILDSIKIDSFGSQQPIKNVASIQVEDARTLRVSPWDRNHVALIDKAITSADLGLSVSVDGTGIRVHFPQLTEETRARIVKVLKQKLEDARVSVRKEREHTIKDLEEQDLPEDTVHGIKDSLQKTIDSVNQQLEEVFKQKEIITMKV